MDRSSERGNCAQHWASAGRARSSNSRMPAQQDNAGDEADSEREQKKPGAASAA
jgi:hypothetical protein